MFPPEGITVRVQSTYSKQGLHPCRTHGGYRHYRHRGESPSSGAFQSQRKGSQHSSKSNLRQTTLSFEILGRSDAPYFIAALMFGQFAVRFHVEHIVARQHGGSDTVENLALACPECNRHKGTNLTGIKYI